MPTDKAMAKTRGNPLVLRPLMTKTEEMSIKRIKMLNRQPNIIVPNGQTIKLKAMSKSQAAKPAMGRAIKSKATALKAWAKRKGPSARIKTQRAA